MPSIVVELAASSFLEVHEVRSLLGAHFGEAEVAVLGKTSAEHGEMVVHALYESCRQARLCVAVHGDNTKMFGRLIHMEFASGISRSGGAGSADDRADA